MARRKGYREIEQQNFAEEQDQREIQNTVYPDSRIRLTKSTTMQSMTATMKMMKRMMKRMRRKMGKKEDAPDSSPLSLARSLR